MKLMTKALENTLKKFPLYSQEKLGKDSLVIVQYFNPTGHGTWLITEGEKQENGDWLLFGYAELFGEYEAGYCSLSELESLRLPLGLRIERELYTGAYVGHKTTVREQIA